MNDKIQLAAMGAEMAEQQQQPMCMAKRIEELEGRVRVMAGLLREARKYVTALGKPDDEVSAVQMTVSRIDALLAGQLPAPVVPEGWQLVPAKPTPAMRDAMRNGSRKDWPSDELCNVRYAAMLAAAPKPEPTK